MYHTVILALVSLLTAARTTLAQQTPLQCHDPLMTRWMLNSAGETPCQVLQNIMQICNPSYAVDWLTPSYSCDNSPTAMTAACCCGSPTYALFSACWSCQYNYTMDIVSTTFTSFEKDCTSIPTPLNEYDPIIRSQTEQINIPLWAEMIPSAGKWDLEAAFRNVTPDLPTASPPIPTNYPIANSNTLSAAAIIGIIVGSVFGTSIMFILAALILWGTLGPGCRRRKRGDDIRIGEHMGYLDGEYIYVRPETIPESVGPNGGRRYTLRRESQHLQPDLGGVSDYSSRGPSEYEDDTFGAVRPLRSQSRADSRTLSYAAPRSPSYIESPDPYSPARHASQDGRYTGFHPNESPLVRDDPRYRSSRDGYGLEERSRRPISGHYSQHRPSASGDYRQSREGPRSGHFVTRPVSGQFNARPRSGQFGSRPVSGNFDFYQVPVDFDTPPLARPPSTRRAGSRPVSGQFSTRPRSGNFEFYQVPSDIGSPTPAPAGSRPISGQFSMRARTSTERKRDHRASARSSFRHASMDSTRRSGDGGARFVRIAEGGRASMDGGRPSLDRARFSREEGRFSREEPRFSSDAGWGRRSREAGHRSRDLYRKASLSEGDEDRERQQGCEGNEGDEESVEVLPRPSGVTASSVGAPPRHSEATASSVGRQVHQQHLRQRSQSARTSCDFDMVVQDYDAESSPVPPTSASSGPLTSNSNPGSVPSKPPRSPLRVSNPQQSDSDKGHRPSSNLRPQPSLLARARGLLSARSSRSNISSGNHSSNRSSSIDAAPVPPSAWQQRLPNILLRNRSGSTDIGRGRSEDSAQGSDVTSVYFSAIGHATPASTTPVATPGATPGARAGGAGDTRQETEVDDGSYRQEVDAGVQLVVESSTATQSPGDSDEPGPPGYLSSEPGTPAVDTPFLPADAHVSETLPLPAPNNHLRVETNANRLSTLTQDTTISVDCDSTMSSGVIQTWEAARRPTGFVGMGRVLTSGEPNTLHSQVSLATAMSNLSDTEDGARLLPDSQANRVE